METESAEEYAAHSEVDPEAAYSEIDVEAAPGSTVIGEIRGTLRQLRRLQGIKGEGLHRRGVARSRRLQAEHERVLVERDRLAEEIGMGDDAIELREIHRAGIDIAAARASPKVSRSALTFSSCTMPKLTKPMPLAPAAA